MNDGHTCRVARRAGLEHVHFISCSIPNIGVRAHFTSVVSACKNDSLANLVWFFSGRRDLDNTAEFEAVSRARSADGHSVTS